MTLREYAQIGPQLTATYDWSCKLYTSVEATNAILHLLGHIPQSNLPPYLFVAYVSFDATIAPDQGITEISNSVAPISFAHHSNYDDLQGIMSLPNGALPNDVWLFAGEQDTFSILREYVLSRITPYDLFGTDAAEKTMGAKAFGGPNFVQGGSIPASGFTEGAIAICAKTGTGTCYVYVPSIKSFIVDMRYRNQLVGSYGPTVEKYQGSVISILPATGNPQTIGPAGCILSVGTETNPPNTTDSPTLTLYSNNGLTGSDPIATIEAMRIPLATAANKNVYLGVEYSRLHYPEYYRSQLYTIEDTRKMYLQRGTATCTAYNKSIVYHPTENFVDQQIHNNATIIASNNKADLYIDIPIESALGRPLRTDELLAYRLAIDIENSDDTVVFHQNIVAPIVIRRESTGVAYAYRPSITNLHSSDLSGATIDDAAFVDMTNANSGGLHGRYAAGANYIRVSTNPGQTLYRSTISQNVNMVEPYKAWTLVAEAGVDTVANAAASLNPGGILPAEIVQNYYVVAIGTRPASTPPVPADGFYQILAISNIVSATPTGATRTIALTWDAYPGTEYYDIYRLSEGGTGYIKLNAAKIAITSFSDLGTHTPPTSGAVFHIGAYATDTSPRPLGVSEVFGTVAKEINRIDGTTAILPPCPAIISWYALSTAQSYVLFGRDYWNPDRNYRIDNSLLHTEVIGGKTINYFCEYGFDVEQGTFGGPDYIPGLCNSGSWLEPVAKYYHCGYTVQPTLAHSNHALTLPIGTYTATVRGKVDIISLSRDFIPFIGLVSGAHTAEYKAQHYFNKMLSAWITNEISLSVGTSGEGFLEGYQHEFDDLGSTIIDASDYYYPARHRYYIGGALGVQRDSTGALALGSADLGDLPVLFSSTFRVIPGLNSELIVTPTSNSPAVQQNPTISWSWTNPAETPDIDYYMITVERETDEGIYTQYYLPSYGDALITKERSFVLETAPNTNCHYKITVVAVPTDANLPAKIGTTSISVLTPTTRVVDLSGVILSTERPRLQYKPIRLVGYTNAEDAHNNKTPLFEGVDKTNWLTMTPPILTTYTNTVEFYYSGGKLYVNTDLRALAGCVALIYDRLYDSVELHLNLEHSGYNDYQGPKLYKYYIACLPEAVDIRRPPTVPEPQHLPGAAGRWGKGLHQVAARD